MTSTLFNVDPITSVYRWAGLTPSPDLLDQLSLRVSATPTELDAVVATLRGFGTDLDALARHVSGQVAGMAPKNGLFQEMVPQILDLYTEAGLGSPSDGRICATAQAGTLERDVTALVFSLYSQVLDRKTAPNSAAELRTILTGHLHGSLALELGAGRGMDLLLLRALGMRSLGCDLDYELSVKQNGAVTPLVVQQGAVAFLRRMPSGRAPIIYSVNLFCAELLTRDDAIPILHEAFRVLPINGVLINQIHFEPLTLPAAIAQQWLTELATQFRHGEPPNLAEAEQRVKFYFDAPPSVRSLFAVSNFPSLFPEHYHAAGFDVHVSYNDSVLTIIGVK